MTKASKPKGFDNLKDPEQYLVAGPGGATHQTAEGPEDRLDSRRFGRLKVIGYTPAAQPLFTKASIADDFEGVMELDARASVGQYIEAAKQQRVRAREARLSESDA